MSQQPITSPFVTRRREVDGVVRLQPYGELDAAGARRLNRAVETEFDAGQTLLIDLDGLSFPDSSGLRILVEAVADAQGRRRACRRPEGLPPQPGRQVDGPDPGFGRPGPSRGSLPG